MKRRRRRWIVALALLLAGGIAGFGWWWHASRQPVVRFAGFREAGGGRVAAFVVENRSGTVVAYIPSVLLRSERTSLMGVFPDWEAKVSVLDFVVAAPTGPRRVIEFTLPVVTADGETLTNPFQVGVDYLQAPSAIWRHPPLVWLPTSLRKPQMKAVWSEVVTP